LGSSGLIVPLVELRAAADGTTDVSEFVSVQVERP
jgi:hypothetical protein